jgi:hypothetical protein
VRGALLHAGEAGEPERLGPAALAALVADANAPWTTARR